jgi:hypothetical protein
MIRRDMAAWSRPHRRAARKNQPRHVLLRYPADPVQRLAHQHARLEA